MAQLGALSPAYPGNGPGWRLKLPRRGAARTSRCTTHREGMFSRRSTPSARTVAAKAGSFTSSGGHTRSPGTASPSPAVSTPTTRCGDAASSRSTCPPAASSAATRTRSVLAPLGGGPLDQPGDPVERTEIVDLEAVEGKAHTEARLEREHELDERHGVHETGLQQLGFGRLPGEGQVLDEDRADFVRSEERRVGKECRS